MVAKRAVDEDTKRTTGEQKGDTDRRHTNGKKRRGRKLREEEDKSQLCATARVKAESKGVNFARPTPTEYGTTKKKTKEKEQQTPTPVRCTHTRVTR